ncbi:MAG: DUF4153 domain-containing protein [Pseudomonadota bacterium]
MTDMKSLQARWLARLPSALGEGIGRFPVATLCAIALCIFAIGHVEKAWGHVADADAFRIIAACVNAALLCVCVTLFCEVRSATRAAVLGANAVGVLVVAALTATAQSLDLVPLALSAALLIGTALAPFVVRPRANEAFWLFNHDLWFGTVFAIVAGLLVALGVSATIGTINYLFELPIRDETWPTIWILSLGFVAPVYWLQAIPAVYPASMVSETLEDRATDDLPYRMIVALVGFILVPLLLAYTAILYVYVGKIGILGSLPKGQIGYLVTAFGVAGVVSALLAYPVRNTGPRLVRFFWRYWFWLALVPLVLLAIAIWERLSSYGLTSSRYLLLLAGIWLAATVVLFGLRQHGRDLRIIPAGAAIILLVTAFGPLSITGLPASQLAGELKTLLKAEGSLNAQGRVRGIQRAPASRTPQTAQRMASIIDYLRNRRQLDAIAHLLPLALETKLATNPTKERRVARRVAAAFRKTLRLAESLPNGGPVTWVEFYADKPSMVDVPDGYRLIGPLVFDRRRGTDRWLTDRRTPSAFRATLVGDELEIWDTTRPLARVDFSPLRRALARGETTRAASIILVGPEARLITTSLRGGFGVGEEAASQMTLHRFAGFLLVPSLEPATP